MFGKIGLPELILILVIALIIFGPRKLPDIGRSIGRGIREFRQATTEISKTVSLDDDEDEIMSETKAAKEKKKENEDVVSANVESETKETITGENQTEPSEDAQPDPEVKAEDVDGSSDEESSDEQEKEDLLMTNNKDKEHH